MPESKEIVAINIEDEMKSSYLDYAMSVIVGRALPDCRDGLKPVHRRILYAMFREGLLSSKRYSKCAGVVGEVLKKYHPHGDTAVYDTLVRMAQPWNMRYPLIDGQGNFGSIDGDSAAAYRYTESRLMSLAEDLMADIDKNTVDFTPNFDDSTVEPIVLPTRFPNLLVNGSDGIAVGMATKIPPHNLCEIINALMALIENPALGTAELLKIVPGPDFPTGASIYGQTGIKQAYQTGRGIVQMRAKAAIEKIPKSDREMIILTEVPFQVNKARLIESIANLVNEEKLEGISEIRDESDRKGIRVVIELKKSVVSAVVLNQLYKHTAMQSSFGIIMLTIVAGQPRILSLKETLELFIEYRKEIVTRRTLFELEEAGRRAHILEGLKIAVENIDEIVALIKKSASPPEAKTALISRFGFSEIQSQAILELRLQRLTGLERDKIIQEYDEIQTLIKKLKEILSSEKLVMEIIVNELKAIREKYGDERRTEIIVSEVESFSDEDLIQEEETVVTVSHLGYIKRNPINLYRAQNRGGRGKTGMTTREEDFVEQIFVASTHSYVLVFTNRGRIHWLKVHEIPDVGRTAKGRAITNLIALSGDEKVSAILSIHSFEEPGNIIFVCKSGTVKKTDLKAYSNPRQGGIIALTIEKGDELIEVRYTNGKQDVVISTREGQTIRFNEEDARPMGRGATGVRGISLGEGDAVVGMSLISDESTLLTVSENGYGKRTETGEYRVQGRGGSGVLTMKTTDKTGMVVATLQVANSDDVMLITNLGKIIRIPVNQISVMGRNTQGVRLIQLETGEKVVSVAKLAEKEELAEKEVLTEKEEVGE
ncbi:MAG: DNA gyrase subunit A [Deltaproteobacteria bacterium RIFCSPLOWO2_12_FULL_40_28]|nr:MAG: DNA gyrase subunit A [Deltaproteobacteria bacterium RIFCSPHIGHO2_02_FULL_40_28]OGQ19891.1 MAG: DNA gyrase subunit A [Deltaproteobacteria bacterium RIFCSPHIGHO2_12_FULL_40_32]OGQ39650.1 MAG: DNA gyrase subunit A [Deltaproteobacteria bacterium RIFCSPLOWO2_02_FULL_40_36]OGQ52906.1 MAG: DNA gyrase subunit A [Deltaproteobacteria bacterium RIFCSPLOWO2_12_FULL_40_28]